MSFPFYKQLNAMDCGPTCLRMVARYYGKHYNTDGIRQVAGYSKEGVSLLGISLAAEKMGFRTRGVQVTEDQILRKAPHPCILHWEQNHFVVLIGVSRWGGTKILVADPAKGLITYNRREFLQHWAANSSFGGEGWVGGTALLLEPTPYFYEQEGEKEDKLNWSWVLQYLKKSKWLLTQVFIALIISSIFQLIFPFLTQSIVDTGINTRNLSYITIVLIAELVLVFSRSIVNFIRSRLLLRISAVLNLNILSDFWIKLIRLPISYFDIHHSGDTLQRIGDHNTIQNFLTGTALNTIFSIFNFIVFAFVLAYYNVQLFFVFLIGSILYFLWIVLFLRIRRKINYENFYLNSKGNTVTLQLVQGMQEIKMNGAEQLKRWEWERVQAAIYRLSFKNLNYNQLQQAGALLIDQGKDVVITFLVAKMVIEGKLTLGMMLAVQYIIGQLSGPVHQFISLIQSGQDTKIAMERLNEVRQIQDEEDRYKSYLSYLPENKNIHLSGMSFTYPGSLDTPVLKDIHLEIPTGKVTALVGQSGSGKTTLLKLLLKFYDEYEGDIKIGHSSLRYFSPRFWRTQCGAVMQDGYIFDDTIARNIVVGEEDIDHDQMVDACKIANILSFIESLPNGFYTKLGTEGTGLSQGQKQRVLIARATYKNPEFLFFDEATNSLDANNEKEIVENLNQFFENKTVVVAAHRLSTVKNAHKIVVLEDGEVAEEGSHNTLIALKGKYYELVKNQLELGG
ncbi:MAG TPA: peptidase domain-containing ABC transporter [Chitinophagaceae bacterium]|nr:peptidase domain-containing ABC transporter [Chitinophagaceae bacterium]